MVNNFSCDYLPFPYFISFLLFSFKCSCHRPCFIESFLFCFFLSPPLVLSLFFLLLFPFFFSLSICFFSLSFLSVFFLSFFPVCFIFVVYNHTTPAPCRCLTFNPLGESVYSTGSQKGNGKRIVFKVKDGNCTVSRLGMTKNEQI